MHDFTDTATGRFRIRFEKRRDQRRQLDSLLEKRDIEIVCVEAENFVAHS
jgi:hypothetical protein